MVDGRLHQSLARFVSLQLSVALDFAKGTCPFVRGEVDEMLVKGL